MKTATAPTQDSRHEPHLPGITPGPRRDTEGAQARDQALDRIVSEMPQRRREVYARIVAAGTKGLTVDELSAMTGRPANEFSGRFTELVDSGVCRRLKGVRRMTRQNSPASVVVATIHVQSARPMPLPNFDQPADSQTSPSPSPNQESATDGSATPDADDVMPDQMTCLTTPRDQHGDPMRAGRRYYVGTAPVMCFDDDAGDLMIQRCTMNGRPAEGSRPQRVDDLPANTKPRRLE
ncbi:hypothetical protein [Crateriforma conspicua]|nr:hypothetical protein [Crateriforma conspicua]